MKTLFIYPRITMSRRRGAGRLAEIDNIAFDNIALDKCTDGYF